MADLFLLPLIRAELSACRPLRSFADAQPSDDLFDDLGLDELDRMTVAMALEEKLGVELPDHVVAKWRTVGDIIAAVGRVRA
jgi:acyl carrier protein